MGCKNITFVRLPPHSLAGEAAKTCHSYMIIALTRRRIAPRSLVQKFHGNIAFVRLPPHSLVQRQRRLTYDCRAHSSPNSSSFTCPGLATNIPRMFVEHSVSACSFPRRPNLVSNLFDSYSNHIKLKDEAF